MATWKEANERTDRLVKQFFHYTKAGREIARASVPFWIVLGLLGSFTLTRPYWAWTMIVVGGYVIVDWLFEKLLDIRESRQGSGFYQAHFPPSNEKAISPQRAYVIFVLLMLATAMIADLAVRAGEVIDSWIPLWESSFMWSIPTSGVVALRLLGSYREGVWLRRKKR